MAVNYPTAEDVKRGFADAFPTDQFFDPGRWTRLERALINPTWELSGLGIEVLKVSGARLFRVQWGFTIDKMNTGSQSALRSSAVALRQQLAILFNGESVSVDAQQSETQEGPPMVVRCWTRGIIGSP